MTCAEVREQLLVLPRQRGMRRDDELLSMHLASCVACRAIEAALVADVTLMARQYASASSRSPAAVVAARAIAASQQSRRMRWVATAVGGLAAAAVAAITLLPHRMPRAQVARPAAAIERPALAVTVPPGKNAIVFATRDPKIDVVWIY